VHGQTLGGTRFVNDAFKEAANRGVGQRPFVFAFGVLQHFAFAIGLVKRNVRFLLDAANLEGALRAFVEQLDEFLVNLIDAAAPVG